MIEVDKENKKIVFYTSKEPDLEPLERKEYDLTMCYICPSCDKIILAWFIQGEDDVHPWKYERVCRDNYSKKRYIEKDESMYNHFSVMKRRGMQLGSSSYRNDCSRCNGMDISTNPMNYLKKLCEKIGLKEHISSINMNKVRQLPDEFSYCSIVEDICGSHDPILKVNVEYEGYSILGEQEKKKRLVDVLKFLRKKYVPSLFRHKNVHAHFLRSI